MFIIRMKIFKPRKPTILSTILIRKSFNGIVVTWALSFAV